MTEDMIDLGRRAVACKGWRWMPGMSYWWHGHQDRVADTEPGTLRTNGELLPDLTDPATLGCLLALVRETHACPYLQVSVSISREHGYRFEANPHHRGAWVDSEEEALVAALEAAP